MQLCHFLTFMILALLNLIVKGDVATEAVCETDDECQEKYGHGALCITVYGFAYSPKKCTYQSNPTTDMCRGASSGACPTYQSPTVNFLESICVFVNESNLNITGNFFHENMTVCKAGNTSESCLHSISVEQERYVGQYRCVDKSFCTTTSLFPAHCDDCKTGISSCNRQGTCTPKGPSTPTDNMCLCYRGFNGTECEEVHSAECDIDCSFGGTYGTCNSQSHLCECERGWNGTAQCTKCSNSEACDNDGVCNKVTGRCECQKDYYGLLCEEKVHDCVDVDCGAGTCVSGECMCPSCDPTCRKCEEELCSDCGLDTGYSGHSEPHIALVLSAVVFTLLYT